MSSKHQPQGTRKSQQGKGQNVGNAGGYTEIGIYRTLISSRRRSISTASNTPKDHQSSPASSHKGHLEGRDGSKPPQRRPSVPRLVPTGPGISKKTSTSAGPEAVEKTAKPKDAATSNRQTSRRAKLTDYARIVSWSKSTGEGLTSGQQKSGATGPSPSKRELNGVGQLTRASAPARLSHAKPSAPKPDAVAPNSAGAPVAKEPPLPDNPPAQPESSESSNSDSTAAQPGTPTPTQKGTTSKKQGTRGASVRFGATTVHVVEIAPGQHLYPIRRDHKTRSGLTYLNPPADTGRKIAVEFPPGKEGKQRRHRQRQAAMERYWLRTEEEEAEWRAEATRMAERETDKYRLEPSSSPSDQGEPAGVEVRSEEQEVLDPPAQSEENT